MKIHYDPRNPTYPDWNRMLTMQVVTTDDPELVTCGQCRNMLP